MVMKKIKPQYGKVVAPVVNFQDGQDNETLDSELDQTEPKTGTAETEKQQETEKKSVKTKTETTSPAKNEKSGSRATSNPNPFLQSKEVFGKARLTKIGYRMRTDYVEILDIVKKVKKGGYTLEAVLDDALTYYFENSEDGREALKKAEIFYS